MDDPLRWSADDQERALAAIAPWYELDFGELYDDIVLYRELSPVTSRILELGAGTGRVAAGLADRGRHVTAVESSPAMLRAGCERMIEAGVEVVQTDMRCPSLPGNEPYDLAIFALSTFQHLLRRNDQLAALRAAAARLSRDGILILDLTAPRPDDVDPAPQPLRLEWTRHAPDGSIVTKLAAQELALERGSGDAVDRASPIAWLIYQYDAIAPDGLVRRSLARFPLRVSLGAGEVYGLLREAGLEPRNWFGSWYLDPAGEGDRLIVLAGHAS